MSIKEMVQKSTRPLVLTSVLAATVLTGPPVLALEQDLVTAPETASALEDTDAGLLLTPSSDAGLGRVELSRSAIVEVPHTPSAGVTLEFRGLEMAVGLPGARESGRGVELRDGAVAFPGETFSNAVIASDDGVQFLTTLSGPASPTRFEYELDLPNGTKLEDLGGGLAAVVDAEGLPLLQIRPAWARDAEGANVATHYSVEGQTLVQHVFHRQRGVTYPVVADPKFEWWGVLPTVKLNRSDTYKMRYGSTPAKLSLCVALGGVAGVALAVPCAVSIAVLSAKAGTVYARGKCLRVIIGPGVLGGAEYKDSYCK